jgi:hypothetical protein
MSEEDRASEWYQYHNGVLSPEIQAPNPTIQNPPETEPKTPPQAITPVKTEPKVPTPTVEVPPIELPQPAPSLPPSFNITSVSPKDVVADDKSIVRIQGTGFTKAITVTVGGVKAEGWSIESEREIRITIGAKIPGGTHDVAVVDIYGRTVKLPKSLTVREAPKEEQPPSQEDPLYPYRTQ